MSNIIHLSYAGDELQTRTLAETLETVGCLVASAEPVDEPAGDQTASLLFNVSNQLDAIASLIGVANSANSRLRHPELYDRPPETKNPD